LQNRELKVRNITNQSTGRKKPRRLFKALDGKERR